MSALNPSHLLISRNPPRSPAHPQLVPTLSSRHSPIPIPSPGILGTWHNSAGSISHGPHRQSQSLDATVLPGEVEAEVNVDIHPTFVRDATLPGKVKVVVGRYEFWCHKEVLWFASPFFQSLLEGNADEDASWAETGPSATAIDESHLSRRGSGGTTSSPDTDHAALPSVLEFQKSFDDDPLDDGATDEMDDHIGGRKASIYLDATDQGPSISEILQELRELPDDPPRYASSSSLPAANEIGGFQASLPRPNLPPTFLHPTSAEPIPPALSPPIAPRLSSAAHRSGSQSRIRHSFSSLRPVDRVLPYCGPEAVVELHEESASAFQDFLFWCYPHLDCKVTWTNVEPLLALSSKLLVPALTKLCDHFLLTHASGKPVMALMLAEQHGNSDLFREASRFVLDQPSWDQKEMECLSDETRLKLAMRRSWFLERLLKLGSIDVKKEYNCRPECPDPVRCGMQLDEKWRQAHSAVSRYGPPQPSVAFRCLRQLETFPTNPSLVMPHPLCQSAAKSWVMILFDRMFQPKIVISPLSPGTEKYWLWIPMT